MGADRKSNTREPVRAPGGLLERLQCRVALDAVGESGSSFGTEPVILQTAIMGAGASVEYSIVSTGADTSWFERRAAYLSDCSVVLPLRPSARAASPSGPRPFDERLRAWERGR